MNILANVKAWWHVYIVGLFKPPVEPEEESAEAFLERVFPLDEAEWEEDE